ACHRALRPPDRRRQPLQPPGGSARRLRGRRRDLRPDHQAVRDRDPTDQAASQLSAVAAYSATPSTIADSSNVTRFEWLAGAVRGSRSGGVPPRNIIVPGTRLSTYEKSSAPMIGLGSRRTLPSPSTSRATSSVKSANWSSFDV